LRGRNLDGLTRERHLDSFLGQSGNQPFGPLLLNVRRPTLIPRPETEEWACRLAALLKPAPPARILDLCTGSGCIPLLLLDALPVARANGVDLAPEAVALATENAALHGLANRFQATQGNLFDAAFAERWVASHGQADLITSNPPYIPAAELRALEKGVLDWEDERALLGDVDVSPAEGTSVSHNGPPFSRIEAHGIRFVPCVSGGVQRYPAGLAHLARGRGLDFYAQIASLLPILLAPRRTDRPTMQDGVPRLVLEVGHDQAREVQALLLAGSAAAVLEQVDIWTDAFGKERVVVGF
jgi:release factor glutamine methyltransferase